MRPTVESLRAQLDLAFNAGQFLKAGQIGMEIRALEAGCAVGPRAVGGVGSGVESLTAPAARNEAGRYEPTTDADSGGGEP